MFGVFVSGFLVVEFRGSLLRLEEPPLESDLHGLRQSLAPLVGFSAVELILTSSDGKKQYRRLPSEDEIRRSRRDEPFRLTASRLRKSAVRLLFRSGQGN